MCQKIKAKKIINVINIDGVIGSVGMKQGLCLSTLNKSIEKAFKGKNIQAVVININSPGGSPVQSELIAKRIKHLSSKTQIPIIAFIEDIAASGGYWIACAAEKIVVAENSLLGSLGVRFSGFGFVKAIESLGIERRVHTKGESKALLDPFLPEKKEDIDMILKVQEDIYQNFKNQVYSSRKEKIKIQESELFSGAIWSGKQALEIGLADEIGEIYGYFENLFGDQIDIKIVNQEKSWLKRKLGLSLSILAEALTNNFDSINKLELR